MSFRRKRRDDDESPKSIDLVDLDMVDISEDLLARSEIFDDSTPGDEQLLFGRVSKETAFQLFEQAGLFRALRRKKYKNIKLELAFLSDLDQRIYIKTRNRVLVHIRLKLSLFRFKLHKGIRAQRLIYIDWLLTQDFKHKRPDSVRLFPGQQLPGLGIFSEISEFFRLLAPLVNATGAFNMPEYFHDALLFQRRFRFYDPLREALFRSLIRDLRRYGAREISKALSENRVVTTRGEVTQWHPGEMVSFLDEKLHRTVFSPGYGGIVTKEMSRLSFILEPQ